MTLLTVRLADSAQLAPAQHWPENPAYRSARQFICTAAEFGLQCAPPALRFSLACRRPGRLAGLEAGMIEESLEDDVM